MEMHSDLFNQRRKRLADALPDQLIVLGGAMQWPLNIPMNLTPFRQNSHILYLTGVKADPVAMLLDTATGAYELFMHTPEEGDDIWHGPAPSYEARIAEFQTDAIRPFDQLEDRVETLKKGRTPLTVPCQDPSWAARMARCGVDVPDFGALHRDTPNPLANALIDIRLCQDATALDELARAARLSAHAQVMAMKATQPGRTEAQLRALIEGIYTSAGMKPSYSPIVTVRGEILHCRSNPNTLQDGQLLLMDAGAETSAGYAADITRVWPVSGRFSGVQKALYELVLAANEACIALVKTGTEYLDIHLKACAILTQGLVDEGLLLGDVSGLVEADAHALFFPHGVGHLLGLDVHDLEDLGDRAGYMPGRTRSSRFGLRYLRLNRALETHMVVTIEPGLYFIPGLLNDPELELRYASQVNFSKARNLLGLGGIRIEDDVVVTPTGPKVLTSAVPKATADVEALVGTAPELLAPFLASATVGLL